MQGEAFLLLFLSIILSSMALKEQADEHLIKEEIMRDTAANSIIRIVSLPTHNDNDFTIFLRTTLTF